MLCFSTHKLFPQFNQAWNPFGQTQDWFPFESFSDKEEESALACAQRCRQNMWQRWDLWVYSYYLAVSSHRLEHWLNGHSLSLSISICTEDLLVCYGGGSYGYSMFQRAVNTHHSQLLQHFLHDTCGYWSHKKNFGLNKILSMTPVPSPQKNMWKCKYLSFHKLNCCLQVSTSHLSWILDQDWVKKNWCHKSWL